MLKKVLNLYKEKGETPLETLERFRSANPEYKAEKMTYAGRLDPMAEGVLIALVGEETQKREEYTDLDKEYEFEWIFGIETDTYDLLGIVQPSIDTFIEPDGKKVKKWVTGQKAVIMQKYPPFSSKVVDGRPLFSWAKSGRFPKGFIVPEHEVEIKKISYKGARTLSRDELESYINESIAKISGDFRQSETLIRWKKFFAEVHREHFVIHKAVASVTSGFYIRQFVHEMGETFETNAVTFSILRNKVGKYKLTKE